MLVYKCLRSHVVAGLQFSLSLEEDEKIHLDKVALKCLLVFNKLFMIFALHALVSQALGRLATENANNNIAIFGFVVLQSYYTEVYPCNNVLS